MSGCLTHDCGLCLYVTAALMSTTACTPCRSATRPTWKTATRVSCACIVFGCWLIRSHANVYDSVSLYRSSAASIRAGNARYGHEFSRSCAPVGAKRRAQLTNVWCFCFHLLQRACTSNTRCCSRSSTKARTATRTAASWSSVRQREAATCRTGYDNAVGFVIAGPTH